MRSLALVAALAGTAAADDFCPRRGTGAAIDLDVRAADIRDVMRLIADAGHKDLVIPDDVAGTVTLHLKRVAWDAAACTVAALHALRITVNGSVLVVTKR